MDMFNGIPILFFPGANTNALANAKENIFFFSQSRDEVITFRIRCDTTVPCGQQLKKQSGALKLTTQHSMPIEFSRKIYIFYISKRINCYLTKFIFKIL